MDKPTIDRILDKLSEGFMVPDIRQQDVWSVETENGTEYVPADLITPGKRTFVVSQLAQYCEGPIIDRGNHLLRRNVWCARLSAPGYLDCTDTAVFDMEDEAREYLAETYGDDIDIDDLDDEA
jgi:hypothetical protein